ncbi:hypothetical protein D6817_00940 [Candidatus Pacearchaeota archaeon]|nr:MAG: hypothetical protein D6817_00940 [Candidatus Pacearchaeota archaeon]
MYIRKHFHLNARETPERARTKDNFARLPTLSAQLKARHSKFQLLALRVKSARAHAQTTAMQKLSTSSSALVEQRNLAELLNH